MKRTILGVNAYHGDVAAALVRDGQLVAAIEEERYRRIKHCAGIPEHAIRAALDQAGCRGDDVTDLAISRSPRAHLVRKVWFAAKARARWGFVADRARNATNIRSLPDRLRAIGGLSRSMRVHWIEHHPTHLASAFFVSPFDDAAVCAIDGFGDFVSTSMAVGRDRRIDVIDRVFFPHSLGLLYLAITQFLGFNQYGDEYKVMGLAPYGAPDFTTAIRRLIRLTEHGKFELDLSYFRHWSEGVDMSWDDGAPRMGAVYTSRLIELLGPVRRADEPVTATHEALAASVQVVFEEAVVHILRDLHERTRQTNLCLAGGCAMNSVMNGKIRDRTPFERVYIQPAAGDNGTALGAALHVEHQIHGGARGFQMDHAYWGPEFTQAAVDAALNQRSSDVRACVRTDYTDDTRLCDAVAKLIADGQVIGWFQGRMEWGARALGNRSILADPRRSDMRDRINVKIKFREKFRPFAPAILEEAIDEYFVGAVRDPFMVQVYPVRPDKRTTIPAVTHVDGSGRLQTVSRSGNPVFWALIKAFADRTGVPVLLNTSFNENEPIVLRPEEALDCFLRTGMDALVLGSTVLQKSEVPVFDPASASAPAIAVR